MLCINPIFLLHLFCGDIVQAIQFYIKFHDAETGALFPSRVISVSSKLTKSKCHATKNLICSIQNPIHGNPVHLLSFKGLQPKVNHRFPYTAFTHEFKLSFLTLLSAFHNTVFKSVNRGWHVFSRVESETHFKSCLLGLQSAH